MENEIRIFNYENSKARVVGFNNEPWWILLDVCKILDLKDTSKVATRQLNIGEVDKIYVGVQTGVKRDGTPAIQQKEVFVVSVSGIYSLIMRSNTPKAEKFKHWITHEALPEIRRAGIYTAPTKSNAEKVKRGEVYEKCVNAQRARLYLEIAKQTDIKSYKDICLSYAAKEHAGDLVLPLPKAEKRTFSATEIAAICGVTANKIGCVANANNMKSPYSVKEVETFRYYENAIARFRELLYEPIRFI